MGSQRAEAEEEEGGEGDADRRAPLGSETRRRKVRCAVTLAGGPAASAREGRGKGEARLGRRENGPGRRGNGPELKAFGPKPFRDF